MKPGTAPIGSVLGPGVPPERIRSCRILVVEDGAASRELICHYLAADGYKHITAAVDGAEALDLAEAVEPDLLVLDVAMPRMDGFEVCRRLSAGPNPPIILVQTAFSGPRERSLAFEVGATDFVSKPILRSELLARIRLHLENRLLLRDLKTYRARLAAELALATRLHEGLLPSAGELAEIEASLGVAIAGRCMPSSELGGDFWCVRRVGATKLAVLLADVSGHGVTAALNSFRVHALVPTSIDSASDPARLLGEINRGLRRLMPSGDFATAFYGLIDTVAGTLTYAAAASPHPILIAERHAEPRLIDGGGLPLGVSEDAVYRNCSLAFPAGARLFLYSDALTETPDACGALLEEAELCRLIAEQLADANSQPLLDAVINRFDATRSAARVDDLTAISISRAW